MKRESFSNDRAKEIATGVIECIQATETKDDLEERFDELEFSKEIRRKMQGPNYPRVSFRITEDDLAHLRELGIISSNGKDYRFSARLATGYKGETESLSPLEKVLYAICWKNGDLGKERHILQGVLGDTQAFADGPVFFEFGQYLAGRNVFILDQHTVRAVILGTNPNNDIVEQVRELAQIKARDSSHSLWVLNYKKFFEHLLINSRRDDDFFYLCDRILFGVGSLLKVTKKRD